MLSEERKRSLDELAALWTIDEAINVELINNYPQIERLQPHNSQQLVLDQASRFNVVCCGRRWGKTLLGMDLAVEPALNGDPVGWFSPTFNMMTDVWQTLENQLYSVITGKNKTERYIRLESGGQIDTWSLDKPDMARGRKYKRVIIDEAAMSPYLMYAWRNVIRPTLTDLKGDAWFLSTPKGRNFFWQLYAMSAGDSDYQAWQMPTSANEYIDKEEIENARSDLPQDVFRQEYLAEFLEDAGSVFRNIRPCVSVHQSGHIDTHHYVMGVDWALITDFTVLVVIDVDTRQAVDIDRFNQIDWPFQRARLRAMAEKWQVSNILAEYNSIGGPNISELVRDGLPVSAFDTNNERKAQVIQSLAIAFEQEEITIPDNPILMGELEAFEATRLPSGKWRYAAPEGMHDDTVIALALAWRAVHNRVAPIVVQEAEPSKWNTHNVADGSRWRGNKGF